MFEFHYSVDLNELNDDDDIREQDLLLCVMLRHAVMGIC